MAQIIRDGLSFVVLPVDDADETEKLVVSRTTGLGKFIPHYVTLD